MRLKLINVITALVINFVIACCVEFATHWDAPRWWFISMWTVFMAIAQLTFLRLKKNSGNKKQAGNT